MSDDTDKPWRLPNAKRMTFDDMAARAQYEWQRAEDAEAEVRHQADRIEDLEAKLNFLVQPDSAYPHPSYRGWVIADESNGTGTFWYAYTYDWKSGEWDSPHFMMVAGDFDDVTAEIDRRTGGKDEPA